MHKLLIKRILPPSLILSLFIHLLILLSITTFIIWPERTKQRKPPEFYTPAYVYKGSFTPSQKPQRASIMKKETSSSNLLKPSSTHAPLHAQKSKKFKRSVLAMTNDFLQQNQHEMIAHLKQEQDPIYLIGDKNTPADPLVKLLGRALSAHFAYPKEAGLFGIRGKALVGFTLHPNGELSNIHLIESTNNQDLDAAALYAANAAPIVKGANKFITTPKYFIVGFIFR